MPKTHESTSAQPATRRLIQICALTVALALIALIVVAVPARSLPQPARASASTALVAELKPRITYTGPTTDFRADLVRALTKADNDARFYAEQKRLEDLRARKGKARAQTPNTGSSGPSTFDGSLGACGGDLPPCRVKQRESHGNYGAFNPTGCRVKGKAGAGCYGAWQFGWFWAGKLGLPDDLSTATPQQQDDAARALWNGGKGCGNWAACG